MTLVTPTDLKPRRGRPSRRDAIVDEAARSFFEKGFDRTSVRDIAEGTGVASGSIFYHFASKEDLLVSVIEEGIRLGHEAAERELVDATTPVRRFRALILGHLKVLHDRRHMHKVSIQEWDRLPPEARDKLKQTNNRYRERWMTVLDALSATGLLKSEPELFRRAQIASLNWTLHYRAAELIDLPALADRMAASSLNLLLADLQVLLAAA